MPIWNPRLTTVTIEFDGPKGRQQKILPVSSSRSFYVRKDREGKNPKVVSAKDSTQR